MSILRSKHSGWTWEGRRTPFGGGGKGGGGSAPPPPDYAGAAQATAQGNLEAARAAAAANRVNQITPYGTLTYSQNRTPTFNAQAYQTAMDAYNQAMSNYQTGLQNQSAGPRLGRFGQPIYDESSELGFIGTAPTMPNYQDFMTYQNPDEGWTATQTLAPAQQELLDIQNALSIGTGKLGQKGLNYVSSMMENPFSTKGLPTLTSQIDPNLVGMQGWDRATNLVMQRLRPQMQRQQEQLDQQLANQGIPIGSEAYTRAKQDLAMQQNDLLNQATLGAASLQNQFYGQGVTAANLANQARQQGFSELAYQRNEPLNTLNAVRSGAQVTSPSFVNVPLQATTAGPDLLGAANALYSNQMAGYNAQQAANANMMGGLMGLGGTLGGAAIMASAMSDPRTKENIKPIGVMDNGLTLYSFEYKDEFKDHKLAGHGVHVGVMADEVEKVFPYAVSTLDDGYKVVHYGLLP